MAFATAQPARAQATNATAPAARSAAPVLAGRGAWGAGLAGASGVMPAFAPRPSPPLRLSQPGDAAEREADRMADRVMRGERAGPALARAPPIARKCEACEEEDKIHRKATAPGQATSNPATSGPATPAAGLVEAAFATPGRPLDSATRAHFEPLFGTSFANVRIHNDPTAQHAASAINARAYTRGDHIGFAAGEYRPLNHQGRHLLAHELAHVSQGAMASADVYRQTGTAETSSGSGLAGYTLAALATALQAAAAIYPSLRPLHDAFHLVEGLIELWGRRQELMNQLLDAIGVRIEAVAGIAQARLQDALAAVSIGAEAASCIGTELARFIASLAAHWRDVISSFVSDMLLEGLFNRSLPTIVEQLPLIFTDIISGEFRSAADRAVIVMTEVNAIVGVFFLWFALFTTVTGAVAGSEIPAAGNAAGAAIGATISEVVGIALVSSVLATEGARVARGVDDMVRFWEQATLREAACREVAEGLFAIALTTGLFFLGPAIQQVARTIIRQAAAAVRAIATEARAAAATAGAVVAAPPGLRLAPSPASGGAMPFSTLPEPAPLPRPSTGGRVARPPRTTTAAPDPAVPAPAPAEPALAPDPAPATGPGRRLATAAAPMTEDPERRSRDACEVRFGLRPGRNDRKFEQRPAINGQTTVSLAAFRLDAGIPAPTGGDTTPASRTWTRQIGCPSDDAGHVVANRFGGFAFYNAVNGNIFPQDLTFNRGEMNRLDGVAESYHTQGCDVCVAIMLSYSPDSSLRPTHALHIMQYRRPSQRLFNPPIVALVRNESRDDDCTA